MPPSQRQPLGLGASRYHQLCSVLLGLERFLIIPGLAGAGCSSSPAPERWMFWRLRARSPKSPRWLEAKGRASGSGIGMAAIEAAVSRAGPLPAAASKPV